MRIQLSDHFTYKKLIKFSIPSIAMMIFTSIYGVVDGYFVSNYAGDIPFKAVNLIMPFLMMISTVGFMFGTGGTAIVAHALGKGDRKKANSHFSLFVAVTFVIGVFLAVLSFVFIRDIAILLGAEGEILENCVLYGRVLVCALPFFVLQFLFQSFCVAAEKANLGLITIIAAGVTNMVLDAVLVISLPQEHKLLGAAIASAASQVIGGICPLIYFSRENDSLLRLVKPKLDMHAVAKASLNGSSEFMSNVSMSLVGMLYNIQLLKHAGDDGIAAYGVMMYVSMIFSSTFIGYSVGTAPIISFNNGARNFAELKNVLRKSVVILSVCGVLMLASAELLSTPLAKLFVSYSQPLTEMTVHGFRIFSLSFFFMGFAIFGSGFFTALNNGLVSALISFLRTLVFQLLAVLLLPKLFGLDGIWLSVVVAEIMAALLSALFTVAMRKKYNYL